MCQCVWAYRDESLWFDEIQQIMVHLSIPSSYSRQTGSKWMWNWINILGYGCVCETNYI